MQRGTAGLGSLRTAALAPLLVLALTAGSAGGVLAAVAQAPGGVLFTYADPLAEEVHLAGDFNGWKMSATPLVVQDGVWSVEVALEPGTHEYKFVIDGQWVADPDNPVTRGDYGNSVVVVAADGSLEAQRPTSNLSYSPKIWVSGRFIALMLGREEGDGFRLRRPDFDFDLDFNVAVSEVLDARLLTNIRNETENVEFFQTRLNLDRGHLTYHGDDLRITVYDNEDVGTFDDPLHLLGAVGIYDHAYGFTTEGARLELEREPAGLQVVYSDDFATGGTTRPSAPDPLVVAAAAVQTAGDEPRAVFDSEPVTAYSFFDTDNDQDVLAARGFVAGLGDWRLAGSARLDRGYNPGTFSRVVAATDTTATVLTMAETIEQWWGYGVDLAGEVRPGLRFSGEYLRGRAVISGADATAQPVLLRAVDSGGTVDFEVAASGDARRVGTERIDVDRSDRVKLGLLWRPRAALALEGSYELETHELEPVATTAAVLLDNLLNTYRLRAALDLEGRLGRPFGLGLELRYHDFHYDARTPWEAQLWFDERNFWLEQDEHKVTIDRMVMLGGNDVISFRPHLAFPLLVGRQLELEYDGIINAIDLSTRPKYVENRFRFTYPLSRRVRLYSDTRWAHYDDPVLSIADDYVSTFLEARYEFAPGINIALSWGVDPYVIDEPVNAYADIGRDQFLFARGANGATARDDFFSLVDLLPQAEQQLEDERRLQIEAIVQF